MIGILKFNKGIKYENFVFNKQPKIRTVIAVGGCFKLKKPFIFPKN